MSFFTVQDLSASYGPRKILDGISFSLDDGCVMGVIGANGSGKTTLLKAVCGILPHTGRCTLQDKELERMSARKMAALCSYIPQRSGISIDISALDVVLMGFNPMLGLLERPNASMREEALRALELVGLSGREEANYMHLSEGQKQLCILARTIVSGARLYLLDEPESALDFRYRYRMLEILRAQIAQNGGGAVIALHDPSLALNFCDRLLLLSQGKVLGVLSPGEDRIDTMEEMLGRIYGPVSLQRCKTRGGKDALVMLKEEEP